MRKRRIGWYVLLLILLAGSLLGWGILLPPVYEDTFLGELKYKQERFLKTEGKRLVIAGGSAAAFGVDSSLLAEAFPDHTPVNMGMYAGLGTGFILDLIEKDIREGDLIVLMPEQDEQTLSDAFDAAYFWQAADGAFDLVLKADRGKLGKILASYPAFAGEKLRYHLKKEVPSAGGVYVRASFDAYGDVAAVCDRNLMPGGADDTRRIRFDPGMLTGEFCSRMNRFCQKAEGKGAIVYFHFSPMNALAVTGAEEADLFCDALEEKLDAELIGTPHDSMMEAGWFYDTNFHLNTAGKRVFTRQLIRDVKAALGDCSPTEIEIGKMPEMRAETEVYGEDSDADCFTYEILEGEAVLTGLTEKGRRKECLVVPCFLGGCPVRVLPAGLFSQPAEVKEIDLQGNIRKIEDGAFAGAGRLKRIHLLQEDPGKIRAGEGLLEGTRADLYTAGENLARYRLDYTWSRYASRLFSF